MNTILYKFMFKTFFNFLKNRWYVLVPLLVVMAIFYFRFSPSRSLSKKENIYIVKKQSLQETFTLSGKIDAEEKVTLRFQTSGKLSWVGVKEDDYVKKFQSIASLDQREVKKKLDKLLNTYSKTRWDFEQTKDDNKDKIVTTAIQRILDKSQFDLNSSVIDVELQNLSVEFANLWTPIEGLVVKVDSPYPGVNITPAQAEFEIVNPKTIYFSALADQTDVVNLRSIKNVEITFDSYPDSTETGKIKSLAFTPRSGETGTVYEVKILLDRSNSDYRYRLGMTGDAAFILKEKDNVLAIPASLVKIQKGQKYVWKKENEARKKVFITLGEEIGEMVEVKEGLNEKDTIL